VADLACGDAGVVYVLPADGSQLLTLDSSGQVLGRTPALPGGLRLLKRGRFLLESSLFERSLRVLQLDQRGVPERELARIRHDGTLWAFDARELGSGLLIAVAGVEDKPLVRAHGEFENIDSFVWLYRFDGDGQLSQLAALDVADAGVVLPKALQLRADPDSWTVTALAAGSGRLLRATWPADLGGTPRLETLAIAPGVSDAVFASDGSIAYADPLFDAWIKVDPAGVHFTRVDPAHRPEPDVRLGEALFFTELMAPENVSAGTHSRFSCETCHFEGGVDGRMHYTGREDVSVGTKPLFGLANNRPHFSRAMDPDLSSVCHNEFRVAGAGSGTDPWFTLTTSRFSWLHELGIDRAELGPLELRAALLHFLYAFSPPPNARSQGREHFSALEADGARAFRDHCQSCHAARLLSDDSASELPFADWERLIFSRNAPLVWARGDYAKTGVLPYVHERGTRIVSLRRLALKPRYFTNGSAPDLANLLERYREAPDGPLHEAAADARSAALPAPTRRALAAFLQLL
jgi:cytochrome c peroxidase